MCVCGREKMYPIPTHCKHNSTKIPGTSKHPDHHHHHHHHHQEATSKTDKEKEEKERESERKKGTWYQLCYKEGKQ